MRVAVLSDTHGPRYGKSCPPAMAANLRGADAIWHAGDMGTPDVLDELCEWASVPPTWSGIAEQVAEGRAPAATDRLEQLRVRAVVEALAAPK